MGHGRRDPDFRQLFEAAPIKALILDPDFAIVAVTDEYALATMTVREEILGRGIFDVFPDNPDDAAADGVDNLRASLERVRQTRRPDAMAVQKYDIQLPASEGGGFSVRYWSPLNSAMVDDDGQLQYIIHRVEDVTQFVEVQTTQREVLDVNEQLQRKTAMMENEILQRSLELHAANRDLRAANAAKSEFLSRMSHELRTPLTAILGFGEFLEMAGLDGDPGDWLAMMLTASRHLLALVDDVLDVARMESGHLTMSVEAVSLADVISDAHGLMRPLAVARDIAFDVSKFMTSIYVAADNQRLRQVLLNLISNAIKYNHIGGAVTVSVVEPGPGRVRIGITDTGRGMSPEQLTRLFVAFERLGAESTGVQGTGLGLVLSRDLVEQMGGLLEVTSEPGVGSTFWIELATMQPVAVARSHAAPAVRHYGSRRSVLYIEDLVANVHLVEEILKLRPDVTLIPAMMGGIGADLARELQPDLVLLDLHLPDVGGDEVFARLRRDPVTTDIPVVILSADATGRQRADLERAGATYLTKPIGVAQLLDTIDAHLMDAPAAEIRR